MYLNDGNGVFTRDEEVIPQFFCSGSVVKPSDFDRDGDLDLFVGGRMVLGKYPIAADSYLLINQNGILENATRKIAPDLMNLGLVTDATWSDYDLDGDPDLIVVGEWMPVSIFKNNDIMTILRLVSSKKPST